MTDSLKKWCGHPPVLVCGCRREEADPHGKDPHTPGAKLDAGKPQVRRGLLEQFPRACIAVAEVSVYGANKYTWGGWSEVPDGIARYSEGEVRHILGAAIDGPTDPGSGHLHAAHEAWNAMCRLELMLREKDNG